MYYIVAVYFSVLFVTTSLVFFPVAAILRVLTFWFDKRLVALNIFTCFWASCYTWLSPIWRVTVTGRENIDRKKACVVVCNHQSYLDIPVIFRTFIPFKWVAKASLFKIPLIGWNMWLNRSIKIERSSTKSQRKMLNKCGEYIRNGSSIFIFPEGTRSRNGELRTFKEGAFLIALQEKTDIVPVVIDGSFRALPENEIIPKSMEKITLNILPPVTYQTFKDMNVRQLTEHIQTIIADEPKRIRG